MNNKYYLCLLLFSTFVFFNMGCGGERTSRPKDSLACVGNACLTERDIEYQIPEAYRESVTPEEKKEYVKNWIRKEILYQEAKEEKLDQDKRVQFQMEQGIKDVLVQEFLEAKLKDKIEVTEAEALSYYQQNQGMFVWEDDFVRINHIFTEKVTGISLAGLMLEEGNKFEDVALRVSEDKITKNRGGDLGFVRIQDLSPEIVDFVLKLKPNEISTPIHTSYGYEIIRLTDRRQKGSPKEFEWAKEQIINMLTLQRKQEETNKLLKQLSEKTRIETFDWASDIKPVESK